MTKYLGIIAPFLNIFWDFAAQSFVNCFIVFERFTARNVSVQTNVASTIRRDWLNGKMKQEREQVELNNYFTCRFLGETFERK